MEGAEQLAELVEVVVQSLGMLHEQALQRLRLHELVGKSASVTRADHVEGDGGRNSLDEGGACRLALEHEGTRWVVRRVELHHRVII